MRKPNEQERLIVSEIRVLGIPGSEVRTNIAVALAKYGDDRATNAVNEYRSKVPPPDEIHRDGYNEGVKEEREKREALEFTAKSVLNDWSITKLSGVKRGHLSALAALLTEEK